MKYQQRTLTLTGTVDLIVRVRDLPAGEMVIFEVHIDRGIKEEFCGMPRGKLMTDWLCGIINFFLQEQHVAIVYFCLYTALGLFPLMIQEH